jgi:hypothetical protein
LVQRTQYFIPIPVGYYVIAYGTSISAAPLDERSCGEGGDWFSMGCITAALSLDAYPLLVDLPIPDNTLDDTILVQNYYFGTIQAGATIPGGGVLSTPWTILPDLSSLNPSNAGVAGFGASWAGSIASYCGGVNTDGDILGDPFTGDPPP